MSRMLVCVVLFGGMLTAGAIMNDSALAQVTKKDKDKDKTTAKAGPGVIEIAEGKDGKFRFFVRDAEGKLLAMSSPAGFTSEKDAAKAVDDLKAVIGKAKVTMMKPKDKDKEK